MDLDNVEFVWAWLSKNPTSGNLFFFGKTNQLARFKELPVYGMKESAENLLLLKIILMQVADIFHAGAGCAALWIILAFEIGCLMLKQSL
jgi:hypothetical protein